MLVKFLTPFTLFLLIAIHTFCWIAPLLEERKVVLILVRALISVTRKGLLLVIKARVCKGCWWGQDRALLDLTLVWVRDWAYQLTTLTKYLPSTLLLARLDKVSLLTKEFATLVMPNGIFYDNGTGTTVFNSKLGLIQCLLRRLIIVTRWIIRVLATYKDSWSSLCCPRRKLHAIQQLIRDDQFCSAFSFDRLAVQIKVSVTADEMVTFIFKVGIIVYRLIIGAIHITPSYVINSSLLLFKASLIF